jgi:hypothetical protein
MHSGSDIHTSFRVFSLAALPPQPTQSIIALGKLADGEQSQAARFQVESLSLCMQPVAMATLYTTFLNLYCPYDLQLENGQLPSPNHQMGTDRLQEEVRAGGQKLLNHQTDFIPQIGMAGCAVSKAGSAPAKAGCLAFKAGARPCPGCPLRCRGRPGPFPRRRP